MKKIVVFIAIGFLFMPGGRMEAADSDEAFCYVSLVDGEAYVIQDGSPQKKAARVNFPLVPGDSVETGEQGRCEIQFDNGTIMRLDGGSRLTINTMRAKSLTTSWNITTLTLDSGRVFTMNNTYNRELFQVVTSRAAIKINKNATSTIAIEPDGNHIFVERGMINLLYGDEEQKLKKTRIRAGEGVIVTLEDKLLDKSIRPETEFRSWNSEVNRRFKELHEGISRIPGPIYNFPRGVVEFAKKWSSLYGEWVYNDLFGYVWKPYDESFQYSDKRPFFHADKILVKNELYLVPQQPWGWIPAHMGNWVWMKKNGWVWIPGTAFKGGMYGVDWLWNQMTGYRPHLFWAALTGHSVWGAWPDYFWLGLRPGYGPTGCATLSDWLHYIYGGYSGYVNYRRGGAPGRQVNPGSPSPPPSLKDIPPDVAVIIAKLDKAPIGDLNRLLDTGRDSQKQLSDRNNARRIQNWLAYRSIVAAGTDDYTEEDEPGHKGKVVKGPISKRDWNRDRIIAQRLGTTLVYSSSRNAVLMPELKISSRNISARQRFNLRTMAIRNSGRKGKPGLIRQVHGGGSAGTPSGSSMAGQASSSGAPGSSVPGSVGGKGGGASNAGERK